MGNTMIARTTAMLLLLGCGGPLDPRTESLTASQHETEAQAEEGAAREHDAQYDPDARRAVGGRGATGDVYGLQVYNPTDAHLEEAAAHHAHAEAHRDRADELRAYEEHECAMFPAETREACPLLLGAEAMDDVEGGVQITFAADQDVAPILQHLRCHIAFAAAQGREGMESCALYVFGARVDAEGQVVRLTTPVAGNVAELRRRARVQAP